MNLVGHSFREARTCLMKSCEYRIKASANAIDPERTKFKHQLVSPDIELERMGVKKAGLLSAWNQAITIIKKEDLNDTDKRRLFEEVKTELNISDVDYEDIPN